MAKRPGGETASRSERPARTVEGHFVTKSAERVGRNFIWRKTVTSVPVADDVNDTIPPPDPPSGN